MSLRRLGRRAWVWLAVLALACVVLSLLLGRGESTVSVPSDAVAGQGPTLAHTPELPDSVLQTGQSTLRPNMASAGSPLDDRTDLCGQPSLQLPRSVGELKALIQRLSQGEEAALAQAQQTQQRVAARLRARPTALEQLAGQVLANDPAPPSEALLRDDPRAYALRYLHCQDESSRLATFKRTADPAHCSPYTAQGWAALEPDNGRAWLAVWRAARQRQDEAAATAAWSRLTLASRFEMHTGLMGLQVQQMAGDLNEFERFGLAVQVDALPSGSAMEQLLGDKALRDACSGKALEDGQRREECRRLARNLSQGGADLSDKRLALKLAASTGLAAEDLAVTDVELKAAQRWRDGHLPLLGKDVMQSFSCNSLRQDLTRMAERAEQGEWAAIRNAMRR